MAQPSDLIYLELCTFISDQRVPEGAEYKGWKVLLRSEHSSGLVVLLLKNRELAVVCRGSGGDTFWETLRNAAYDLNFRPKGPLKLHRGILKHTRLFLADDALLRLMWAWLPELDLVTFTGFSLGGGMAPIMALELDHQMCASQVVTFGAPLITKEPAEMARRLADNGVERVFHYEMIGDPVSNLPPFTGWGPIGDTKELPSVRGREHIRSRYQAALKELHSD